MHFIDTGFGPNLPGILPLVGIALIIVLVWSIVWKGLALWRAATRGDKWWFVIFLVVNTMGILEIVYLFAVSGAKLSDLLPERSSN